MKLRVSQQLDGGVYWVNFSATDFTAEELKKMESFGVPKIDMVLSRSPNQQQPIELQLNQMSPALRAAFETEEQAKAYAQNVINQVREAMRVLRERKDDFSKTEEVEL